MKSILGKKIGMTQVFTEDGELVPVTVVECGPMVVTQIKTNETDGYNAIQVGVIDRKEKHVTKPLQGHFNKANVSFKKVLREFRVDDPSEYNVGDTLDLSILDGVEVLDAVGISKGKGTQGAIKRHNYGRGPEGHGSKSHRVAGARSAGSDPARVFKGRKGSGKMGHDRVTVQNLSVVKIDTDRNVVLVKGAIPGNKGGLVTLREAKKLK